MNAGVVLFYVQTPTEIEELSLRAPRPVHYRNDRQRVGLRAGLGTIQNPDALFICAKAKRQRQLRQGEIDYGGKNAKKFPKRCISAEILLHKCLEKGTLKR
ncbi:MULTISPECIES: hypothetical protein [Lysinibacillus]|uniref:hypothetical protein n=1 Tax=Lysinibacillus TaxID=400634 RepID=UPI00083C959D|nr:MULTISPECIES: hypothetical protein [Lysinibacillus]